MCRWNKWLDIDNYAVIPSSPGVYRIRLIDSAGHSPVPVKRLLCQDEDGLLVIGESKDLRNRLKEFHKVTKEKTGFLRHSAGDRLLLNLIFRHISSKAFFDNKGLEVSFTKAQDKAGAQRLEELLLKVYFIQFGELPPLNNNMPDKDSKLWNKALLTLSSKCSDTTSNSPQT